MFRLNYIMDMITKHKKDSIVSIPLMVNFKDIAAEEIESLYSTNEVGDTTVTSNVIFRLNAIKPKGTTEYTEVALMAEEHVYSKDAQGNNIGTPSIHRYSLLTQHELDLIAELEEFNLNANPSEKMPKHLLDVRLEKDYEHPISRIYSEALENYLTDDKSYGLSSFYDLIVPVVERNSATLIKASVYVHIIEQPENWVANAAINPNMLAVVKNQYATSNTKKTKAVLDVQDAFSNYMNCVYSVFSVLSAEKRGGSVHTSELLRSCPEKTTKDMLLDKATDTLRVSPFSSDLPLFSSEFLTTFLMGNIPMFLIGDSTEEGEYFGCDIFKQLKEKIITNINLVIADLKEHLPRTTPTEAKEVLNNVETGTTQLKMCGMYSNYLKSQNRPENGLSALLDGKYDCVFVDLVVYALALQVYARKGTTNFSLFDFINMVSPVQVTKEV